MTRKAARGRVTPKGTHGPNASSQRDRAGARRGRADQPAQSPRYTPPTPQLRVRPRWHRWSGWLGVAAGVVVVSANDVMLMGENLALLPGGHSEAYLLVGVAVAASSSWFLGLFDRGTTVFD